MSAGSLLSAKKPHAEIQTTNKAIAPHSQTTENP